VRAALEASGLDHGSISVHEKMRAMGLVPVPSTASLARIFREAGVARLEPRKKPRSAWRRFVYPAPNACRQLDATEYVLTGGRKCVIFQLIDDHSRYAVASHAAAGQIAKDAIAVFDKAVAAHGVPQRLLADNGLALNASRRGLVGRLVSHVAALGTEAITGKPHKPTTHGMNERFHQTVFRYLDKQPLAATLAQLQAQIDALDHIYKTTGPRHGAPTDPTCRPTRRHTPQNGELHRRDHRRQGVLQDRCRPHVHTGSRRQRRRPARQRDHHHRPPGRDPRRTHQTRSRHPLRPQRPTPRNTTEEPPSVTEVLTHQPSPMS
jgi:hypothetical protein